MCILSKLHFLFLNFAVICTSVGYFNKFVEIEKLLNGDLQRKNDHTIFAINQYLNLCTF